MFSKQLETIKSTLIKHIQTIAVRTGHANTFHRITVDIDTVDLPSLFIQLNTHEKIFFESPHSQTTTIALFQHQCITTEEKLTTFMNSCASDDIRIYGGMRFDGNGNNDDIWSDYPAMLFVLPKLEIVETQGAYTVSYNMQGGSHIPLEQEIDILFHNLLQVVQAPHTHQTNSIHHHTFTPDYQRWCSNIDAVYKLFVENRFQKIALARRTSFACSTFDIGGFFQQLQSITDDTCNFYFPSKNSVFIGATPEMLFIREGDTIMSDSLAGTRPRGKTQEEDSAIEKELLSNTKELHEQDLVSKQIIALLQDICITVQATGATRVKKLHGIQHLHNTIRGSLKESISDIEIIQQLHPTPAVGAMPKNNSVSTIYDIEQWDRGWYAAPFGFISKKRSEISVAIRTALYQENQFHLFTGAGIVEGSVADNEWKEINHKMQKYLQIMEYDINR